MQFSSLFLKSSMTRANNWRSIGRMSGLDGFLHIIQCTGFVSVNTRFQIPSKKKSHIERSRERGGHGTSPKREMRCLGNMFRRMSLTPLQCALWHHLVEATHWHSLLFFSAVLSTTHWKDVRFQWVTLYMSYSLRGGSGWNVLILLASCQQTCMTYTVAVCTGKNCWWWTEELSETCRFLFQK